MSMDRQERLENQADFVNKAGWGDADLFPMKGDASFRRYTRLVRDDKSSCLLMDAPAPMEDIEAYLKVTHHLNALGLRVPAIYAEDQAEGFALIEDFGVNTFTHLLNTGEDELSLYMMAVDALKALHSNIAATDVDLPPYDMSALIIEAMRFVEWFVPAATGEEPKADEVEAYQYAWEKALARVESDRRALVLRDYLVDNIMVVDGGKSIERCALLDYQDALIGSPAYDLMSLLEDARRDVSPETRRACMAHYFDGNDTIDRLQFLEDFSVLGAQRHAKILGVFVRLSRRDGKHGYLKHLPRVQRLLVRSLSTPALSSVRNLMFEMVPDLGSVVIEEPYDEQKSLSPGDDLKP